MSCSSRLLLGRAVRYWMRLGGLLRISGRHPIRVVARLQALLRPLLGHHRHQILVQHWLVSFIFLGQTVFRGWNHVIDDGRVSQKVFRPGRIMSSSTSLLRTRSRCKLGPIREIFASPTASFWSLRWTCIEALYTRWQSIMRKRWGLASLPKRCSTSRVLLITLFHTLKTLVWLKLWFWQGSQNQIKNHSMKPIFQEKVLFCV